VAAAGLGFSEASMRRVKEVKDIVADDSAPDHIRDLAREALAEMDEEKKIHAPWMRARTAYKEWKSSLPPAKKPDPVTSVSKKKTTVGAAERYAKIAELAEQGYSSAQIAQRLGYASPETLRVTARKQGIEIPADRVLGRTRKIDHHRIVSTTVADLEGTCMSLDLLDVAQLEDLSEIDYWVESLTKSAAALRKLCRQLSDAARTRKNQS